MDLCFMGRDVPRRDLEQVRALGELLGFELGVIREFDGVYPGCAVIRVDPQFVQEWSESNGKTAIGLAQRSAGWCDVWLASGHDSVALAHEVLVHCMGYPDWPECPEGHLACGDSRTGWDTRGLVP
jgi:hypothetical protein